MIITMQHARAAKLCRHGWRTWFAVHKLDYQEFRTKGLSEEQFTATNDALATRLVEAAHGRRK
jgi:hypothetical protein